MYGRCIDLNVDAIFAAVLDNHRIFHCNFTARRHDGTVALLADLRKRLCYLIELLLLFGKHIQMAYQLIFTANRSV